MTALADAAERPATGRVHFELPPELEASVPPEARGITRDAVRLMVAYKSEGRLVHANFSDLPRFLDAGDLVVVNTSGTLAAEVDAVGTGRRGAGGPPVDAASRRTCGSSSCAETDGPFRDAAPGLDRAAARRRFRRVARAVRALERPAVDRVACTCRCRC